MLGIGLNRHIIADNEQGEEDAKTRNLHLKKKHLPSPEVTIPEIKAIISKLMRMVSLQNKALTVQCKESSHMLRKCLTKSSLSKYLKMS